MLNTHSHFGTSGRVWPFLARFRSPGNTQRLALVALTSVTLFGTQAVEQTAADTFVQVQTSADAKERRWQFSDATLRDRYGFHVLALSMNPANPTTGGSFPFAISGYYQFNGDGTLHGKDTVSRGGALEIVDREYVGTYQVNPDGTGTLKLFISPVFEPEGRFVITKSGEEVEIIFAVPGNLNAFTLKKQHTR